MPTYTGSNDEKVANASLSKFWSQAILFNKQRPLHVCQAPLSDQRNEMVD